MINKNYFDELPNELKELIVNNVDSKQDMASLKQTNKEIADIFAREKNKLIEFKLSIENFIINSINYAKGIEVNLEDIKKLKFNFNHYSLIKNSETLQKLFNNLTIEQINKLYEVEPKLALIIAFNKSNFSLEALALLEKTEFNENDKNDLQNLFENLKPSITANLATGYIFINLCRKEINKDDLNVFLKIAETGLINKLIYQLKNSENLEHNIESLKSSYLPNFLAGAKHFIETIDNISYVTSSWDIGIKIKIYDVLVFSTLLDENLSTLVSNEKYTRVIDYAIKDGLNKNINIFENVSDENEEAPGIKELYKINNKDICEILKPHPITGKDIFDIAIENYNSFAVNYLLNIQEFAGKVNLKKLVKAYNSQFSKCITEKNKQELLKIKAAVISYAKDNNVKVDLNERMLGNIEEIKQEKAEETTKFNGFGGRY